MKVFLDCDCVLCDFIGAQVEYVNTCFGLAIPLEVRDVKGWDYIEREYGAITSKFWKTPGMYDKIAPFEDAAWFVEELKRRGHDVWSITSSSTNMIGEKTDYIFKNFGIEKHKIIHHWLKYLFTTDAILIDDYHLNIHAHIVANQSPAIGFNYNGMHGWANRDAFVNHELVASVFL